MEEPLEKGDYAALSDLRAAIDVPVATGENFYNETQFRQAIAADAVDVLQPDVCRVGGVTPWLRVAEAAATAGLPVSPHYVEPIHVHLACTVPNVPYVEHHSTVLDRVLASPLALEDGVFTPSKEPGHGVEFEEIERFQVE